MHQPHVNVKIIKLVNGEDVVTVLPTGKNQLPDKSTLLRLENHYLLSMFLKWLWQDLKIISH